MLLNPRPGSKVQAWYRKELREWWAPYHGKIGRVVIARQRRPRNHIVDFDGHLVAIPCGNLRKPK